MDNSVKMNVLVGINQVVGILGILIFNIIVSVVLKVVVDDMLRVNGVVSGLFKMVCILVFVNFNVMFISRVIRV